MYNSSSRQFIKGGEGEKEEVHGCVNGQEECRGAEEYKISRIYRNSLAAPLFSLVATATRASSRPMPDSRTDESGKTPVRGSRSA